MPENRQKKRQPPFSLRLTPEERARLERSAGNKPLGEYVKSQLFGDEASPRRKSLRKPTEDKKLLAEVLAKLGQSRLANNLNQLAKAANSGSLPLTPDTTAMLRAAYRDVQAMKRMLMTALGILER